MGSPVSQSGREALLFIGHVVGGREREVLERALECASMGAVKVAIRVKPLSGR